MGLTAGTQLGSHQIIGLLGAGGMGEVYRAQDTKLNRQVAIKILPAEYSKDPERVARFQREAQAVAALNHPGVAAIYEFAQANDIGFLVLELVEGETLADRLRRGAVPPEEALAIAKEICEALEAAHEKGICHRDLKPANIKLTEDGKVKVLDFGLAKVLQDSGVQANVTNSPTLSLAGTFPGVILGTAGYMSPEQAKGFAADHRSDIFSLGCVLYELLTGRQAFEGDTASEILASVLKSEPDFTRLPARLNPRAVDLLRRCLEKQPKRRWHAIADVRAEIEDILARGVFAPDTREIARPWWRRAIPVAAGVFVGAALTATAFWRFAQPPPPGVVRFALTLPEGQQAAVSNRTVLAISPDGSRVAYATSERLYLRLMSELEARPIPGSESPGALSSLAFSPDGNSIAFHVFTDRSIKRLAVSGGAPVVICHALQPFGLTWGEHGIVFVEPDKGIFRVSPNGGVPELIVEPRSGETLSAPEMLPGGRAVLFSVTSGSTADRWDQARIMVQSLDSGQRTTVLEGGSDARYIPTGHIVYAVGGTMLAVPFDIKRLAVVGGPVPIVEGVRRASAGSTGLSTAQLSFSKNGSLAYIPGPVASFNVRADLALIDRAGNAQPLKLPPAPYEAPRVSPNGRFVAVGVNDGKETSISVYELSGASSIRRLTFGGNNRYPTWSHDSEWVAYQSDREGDLGIFRQRADGTGAPDRLTKAEAGTQHLPHVWSPDGARMLFSVGKDNRFALWTLSWPSRTGSPWGNIQAGFAIEPSLSADGRWIAYQADETGAPEIFVQPFPHGGAKYMIPRDTQNHHPLWSPASREIFYIPRQGVSIVIPVMTQSGFGFGAPSTLQRGGRVEGPAAARRNHDILPDGKRFIGVLPEGAQGQTPFPNQIRIVLNWFEDLKQRVPAP